MTRGSYVQRPKKSSRKNNKLQVSSANRRKWERLVFSLFASIRVHSRLIIFPKLNEFHRLRCKTPPISPMSPISPIPPIDHPLNKPGRFKESGRGPARRHPRYSQKKPVNTPQSQRILTSNCSLPGQKIQRFCSSSADAHLLEIPRFLSFSG
jgi:hypothetical protein